MWHPNGPKQAAIYNDTTHRYIHAIGDPRSGKSAAFFQKAIKEIKLQRGIKGLITRDSGTQILNFTFPQFMEAIDERLILDIKMKPFPWVKFITGSEVFFTPYDEIDITKAGGSENGFILIDEAARFSRRQWDYMDTRLSQKVGVGIKEDGKKFQNLIKNSWLGTTANPAGRGWTWKVYSVEHPLSYLGGDPNYLAFKFFLDDNIANLPAAYVEAMRGKPQHIRDKILGGNEDPLEGLVFPEFTRELNVCKKRNWIPPTHWRVYGGMDHGFQTPTTFLPMAVSESGHLIFFREYRKSHKTIQENSESILKLVTQLFNSGMSWMESCRIDPSTNTQDGKSGPGKTVFELYRDAGLTKISLVTAKRMQVMDRVARMRDLLKPDPEKKIHPITGEVREEGWPTVIFTDDCDGEEDGGVKVDGGTITEFEEWEIKPTTSSAKNPNEKPEEKNDHGIDACCYAVQVYFGENSPEDPQKVIERESTPSEILRKKVYANIEKQLKPAIEQFGALQGGNP